MERTRNLQCGRSRALSEMRKSWKYCKLRIRGSGNVGRAKGMKKNEKVKTTGQVLAADVSSSWESFSELDGLWASRVVLEMYSLFSYYALHNLSLKISKMMKECLFAYISSGYVVKG